MERANTTLLLMVLIVLLAVAGLVYRADEHARGAAAVQACLDKAQATATVILLTPSESVDKQGRLEAITKLGAQIEAC